MPEIIPAAPGWYLKTADDPALEPIVAWRTSTYREPDGSPVEELLPYISNGAGLGPSLITHESMERGPWMTVYLPNRDPASTSASADPSDCEAVQAGAAEAVLHWLETHLGRIEAGVRTAVLDWFELSTTGQAQIPSATERAIAAWLDNNKDALVHAIADACK